MKITPLKMTDGTLVDPETKREFAFSKGQPIEVPDETAKRAVKSGLWIETVQVRTEKEK